MEIGSISAQKARCDPKGLISILKPYIILDRDGTLIELVPYLSRLEDVEIKLGVYSTLSTLNSRGYRFGIATNQSAIGRRIASKEDVDKINLKIMGLLQRYAGVEIDFIKVCPHLPDDGCNCRKPQPGLILEEITAFKIDCSSSYMVGDSESDMLFGKNLHMKTILLRSPNKSAITCADICIESFHDLLRVIK